MGPFDNDSATTPTGVDHGDGAVPVEAPVETRYVGQLIGELAEARTELHERSKDPVSEASERQFSTSWLRGRLRSINEALLTSGTTALASAQISAIIEQVLSTTFDATKLWRVWTEDFGDAQNLWVIGTERCRVQLGDGSMVDGPVLAGSNDELERAVRSLRAMSSRPDAPWNRLAHQLEFVVPSDATRVTATKYTTGTDVFVTLRRATMARLSLADLVANQTMPPEVGEFLNTAVAAGMRILVGGAMNSGKTVLLRALAASLDPDTPLVLVEGQAELMLKRFAGDPYPKWILETESLPAGADGHGEVELARLIKDAQRMSPGCVLVGEVRGEEAQALSKAVNQGYQVMGTIHSSSAVHAVRNAALYLQEYSSIESGPALQRMAMGIDIAVFLEQINGTRRVAEVVAVGDSFDDQLKSDMVYTFGDSGLAPLPEWVKRVFRRKGLL